MFKRSIMNILQEALSISPAVLLTGARQVGKSTLCLGMDREYRVFDDLSQRAAALQDPIGYIRSLPKPVTIDEIQKVPEVLDGIKLYIDTHRRNGDFLLTGSANLLDMKQAKDTLAGRIVEITLYPLSQKEIHDKADENIVDQLFTREYERLRLPKIPYHDLMEAVLKGGYPEVLKIHSSRGRSLWYNSYISTYIERDIRDVGELRDISAFIRFYNILAPRSCMILNKSNLASDAGLSEATVGNYLSMLEMIYQISLLKPYSSNISKRFIKSPKFYMNDSGQLCHLLGLSNVEEITDSPWKGNVIETFVYNELLKHLFSARKSTQVYHYRTTDKKEIDFILVQGEQIVALEVKASQSVGMDAFKHIVDFQKRSQKDIVGIVLHAGEDILPFGDEEYQRYAIPLSLFF